MVNLLAQQKSMQDWGIQVEAAPVELSSFVLGAPQLQVFNSNQVI